MSKLKDSYSSHAASLSETPASLQAISDEFPSLVEALVGIRGEDKLWELPPCTIMIFLEGDRVKFCLNPKSGPRVAFGTVDDLSKGLSALEKSLSEGNYEWKARGGRRFS